MDSEPRQITDLDELAGKTIKRAVDVDYGEKTGLIFDDGSFAIIRGDVQEWETSDSLLVDLGLISKAEYRRREAQRDAAIQAESEVRERQQYERLKAKFEGQP